MKKIAVLLIMSITLAACSVSIKSKSTSVYGDEVTVRDIEDAEKAIEKARMIGRLVGQESEGLIFVSFVAVPSHGTSSHTGEDHFGVHYSMSLMRSNDTITTKDMEKAQELAGRIFQLTTKYVLKDNAEISHMGVQIINPDAWFWNGRDAHLYIATRDVLLEMDENSSAEKWFKSTSDTPLVLLTEKQLQEIITRLRELQNK